MGETGLGDDRGGVWGGGAGGPGLARQMTSAMLSVAGIRATAGFVGKFYLIDATVDGGYTWLGVMIVIGSMISLGYYLRVLAAMWMPSKTTTVQPPDARPAMAGGPPAAVAQPELPASLGAGRIGATRLGF